MHGTLLAKRNYTFDELGRVKTRSQTRGASPARNDSFGYNLRSELTSTTLGTDNFAYSFDNIGNRLTSEELAAETAYTTNNLNQYTAITPESGTAFTPTFDADGNQTSIQTATGIWAVTYNAENRPVLFVHAVSGIQMACKYDHMGRRFEKEVSYANGEVLYCKRYAYEGYLQIAEFTVSESAGVETHALETITFWDPSQPTATRPLAQTDFSGATQISYFYTHDLTKNVCELIDTNLNVITTYDYTPFGAASITGANVANRFMFSSEFFDQEPALVYYNYRHYNPIDGRWINRDLIQEKGGLNLYTMTFNNWVNYFDILGFKDNIFNVTLPDGSKCSVNCAEPDPQQAGKPARICNLSDMKELNDEQRKSCEELVTKAKNDSTVKKIFNELKKNHCNIPPIHCTCCTGGCSGAGAWHFWNPSRIYICAEKKLRESSTLSYLKHELTHALQACRKAKFGNCVNTLMDEIEAYKADGSNLKEALSGAVWSACYVKACKKEDIQKEVKSMYNYYNSL